MSMDVEQFLAGFAPNIQQLAEQLRSFVMTAVPGCEEKLHAGWKVLSYSQGQAFCAIAPHKAWVNLQFHAGVGLHDPAGLLTGTGKAMRHVRITQAADVNEALAALLRQAVQLPS